MKKFNNCADPYQMQGMPGNAGTSRIFDKSDARKTTFRPPAGKPEPGGTGNDCYESTDV